MQLLVSVRDSSEASAALLGGAAIVDAKEPGRGPLAPVDPDVLLAIDHTVPVSTILSVALGDGNASMLPAIVRAVPVLTTRAGLVFKAAITDSDPGAAAPWLRATCVELADRDDRPALVVARYVDASWQADDIGEWITISARAGARGFLLDTSRKDGPGLLRILAIERLHELRVAAAQAGIWFALAGGLQLDDLDEAAAVRPDVLGVRGAACDGGREGQLSAARVRELRLRLLALSRRQPVPRG